MGGKLYKITDATAARMLEGFRHGQTPRMFAVTPARLEAYLQAHPEYAIAARPLIRANAIAAQLRKAAGKREKTHCSRGHPFTPENTRLRKDPNDPRRECKICERERAALGSKIIKPQDIERVRELLKRDVRIGSFTGSVRGNKNYVMSHSTFSRLRREDAEIDVLATRVIDMSRGRAQRLRWVRVRNQTKRNEANDYHVIYGLLPANFPDRDDVVSAIFEDLLTGALKREDVKARVKSYVAAHNKMFPTKYAKFGDSLLVSLDEAPYEDRSGTRGDNVTCGLWD